MNVFLRLTIFVFVICSFSSCFKDNLPCKIEKEDSVTETRILIPWSAMTLQVDANIFLVQDTTNVYQATITAPSNIIDFITIEKKNDSLLTIYSKRCLNNRQPINITLRVPSITYIQLVGPGNINTLTKFSDRKINIELRGAGNISYQGDNKEVSVKNFSAGNITLTGTTQKETFDLENIGKIQAYAMIADSATVQNVGVADVQVLANQYLDCTIYGKGNIYYKGYPGSILINDNGKGDVINDN